MAKKYIDAELIKSTRALYFDIDACITELIRARTEQNEENEGKALFRMEGLMVATMQQLDCIIDTLQQEQPCDTCTNDKGCVTCNDGELWEGKEQPSEELESEIEKYFQGLWPGMETAEQCNTDMHFTPPAIMRLANHFYELGKQSKEPISEDLEKAADKYSNENEYMDVGFCVEPVYIGHKTEKAFIAGAEWQKEQMISALKNDGELPIEFIDKFHEIDRNAFQNGQKNVKSLLLKDAVEGEVCKDHIVTEKPFYFYQSRLIELPDNLKEGDKVKIVIVKEDKK